MAQNLQQTKKAFLMAKYMFTIEAPSWSFLSMLEAKPKFIWCFEKKVYVEFVLSLFQWRKTFHRENRLSWWENFICHKRVLFLNQENFHSKWDKIYSYCIIFNSQIFWLGFLLLWQVNFYLVKVNYCLFWVFVRNLQCRDDDKLSQSCLDKSIKNLSLKTRRQCIEDYRLR